MAERAIYPSLIELTTHDAFGKTEATRTFRASGTDYAGLQFLNDNTSLLRQFKSIFMRRLVARPC